MASSDNKGAGMVSSFRDQLTTGKVVRHAFLPGILPRIRRFGQVFSGFAYLLALVYRSARLLPQGHPMLNPANIGRFGISDVIATAASNLVIRKENTDQIMIFGAIVIALVMVVIQAFIIGFYALMPDAHAASTSSGMFTTPSPEDDVVFTFLQQVIGVDKFYNSSGPLGFSASVATGLHKMLGFYSTAMMIIAVIIVIYYVITVVGESAQSGTPFGRRFNGLWAPVRLVLALGLLVPLGNGLNAAQYSALYAAKFGSSLATNAWTTFSTSLEDAQNITIPPYPGGFTDVGKNVFLYEVCMAAYNQQHALEADDKKMTMHATMPVELKTLMQGGLEGMQFEEVSSGKMMIRYDWSVKGATTSGGAYNADRANATSCGHVELAYPMPSAADSKNPADANYRDIANNTITAYKDALETMASRAMRPNATTIVQTMMDTNSTLNKGDRLKLATTAVTADQVRAAIQSADQSIMSAITNKGDLYKQSVIASIKDGTISKNGWGNAASYYIKLAYANQKIQQIVKTAAPEAATYSAINAMQNEEAKGTPSFFKFWASKTKEADGAVEIKNILQAVDSDIIGKISSTTNPVVPGQNFVSQTWQSDGPLWKAVKEIFSVGELQDIADPDKQTIFPMVLLSNLGAALITKAMIAFGVGAAAGFFNAAVGNFVFMFGFIGISVGFLLYYVLPFMPFIYFFFAVAEWVMSIVEALIGAPLWALAHLRIDGEGMPGQAAMNGYLILFGIIIRPILILFGLISSYIVFNAGAFYLSRIFGGAVSILRDGSTLNSFTMIGYLIIYAIIVYNLALVSFKLIDTIPQQTFRWMGQSNLNFNDGKPDPIGHVGGAATAAGGIISGNLANSVSGMTSGLGNKVLGKGGGSASVKS